MPTAPHVRAATVPTPAEPRPPTPPTYRRPQVYLLGGLGQVEAVFAVRFRDGPRSTYWYDP